MTSKLPILAGLLLSATLDAQVAPPRPVAPVESLAPRQRPDESFPHDWERGPSLAPSDSSEIYYLALTDGLRRLLDSVGVKRRLLYISDSYPGWIEGVSQMLAASANIRRVCRGGMATKGCHGMRPSTIHLQTLWSVRPDTAWVEFTIDPHWLSRGTVAPELHPVWMTMMLWEAGFYVPIGGGVVGGCSSGGYTGFAYLTFVRRDGRWTFDGIIPRPDRSLILCA